nr:hypothetical protein [Tanacetum cinerariifolium]
MEESKEYSWISEGQKLETVRVMWSAHYNIHNYTDDLAGREKISTNKDVADIAKEVAVEKDAEMEENANVQGRQAESQAQIYQIDLEHTDKVLKVVTAASATITAATNPILAAPSAARRRKGVDKAYARESEAKINKNIDWNEVIEQVQRKEKEGNVVMRYQALKRKPKTKAQAKKNMMIYLRNMAGFKMDYFKGMSYDDIRLIFEKKFNSNVAFLVKTKEQMEEEDIKALKRTSERQAEKATKKQKLDEEVEELKKHLQIVPNDDDDVYTVLHLFLARSLLLIMKSIQRTTNNTTRL